MRSAFRLLIFGFLCTVAGCASGAANTPYPRVPVDEVAVYESEADIDAEFEVMARITPRRRLSYETISERQLRADALRQAARLGANALLVLEQDAPLTQEQAQYTARTDRGYESKVYFALRVFSDPEGRE